MTPAEYDAFVWSMIDPKIMQRGAHAIEAWAAAKGCSEAGEELAEIVKRDYHEIDIDELRIVYEKGDKLFYISAGAQAAGYSLQTIMEMNVAKLQQRGNYANYLRTKDAAETPADQSEAQKVIQALRDTLRHLEDKYPPEESTA